ncbi:glycosyltransferase family 4 protein [Robertkochia aurantiaca]|uniref:glycosyltransferase family 4 protein n=1 Tax=Robertkochia aurantiaca TaxID=2873700 RepID=UPI001CCAD3FB|nr:glycosyltransferase family 1 protein [Robertkochia sp. 3YJGBD-33]
MPSKNKIIINGRFLSQPITGVQRFASEITAILCQSKNVEVVAPKNIIHWGLAKKFNVKIIGTFVGHSWEQFDLMIYLKKEKCLLLSLCNTGPLLCLTQVITIHDLGFRKHPEWYSKKFSLYYNFLIPKLAKLSKHILTVSEYSKMELINELGIIEEKISVVYNAPSKIFRITEDKDKSHGNNKNYILTVSSHHPRKNFKNLISAFNLMSQEDLFLYIIGNNNNNFNSNIDYKTVDNVRFLENISDNELVDYYKGAKLFVFASFYEGFGIPIIEAMSMGVPVCVSDIPVFHEVCGSSAYYFDPHDVEDMANKIHKSLVSPKNIKESNISDFNWGKSAKKIFRILENIDSK